jgi:hypothetical protein
MSAYRHKAQIIKQLLLFRTLVHGDNFETISSTKYTKYAKILDTPVSSKGSKEP